MDIVLIDVYVVIGGIFYGIESVDEFMGTHAIVTLDTMDQAFVSMRDVIIDPHV